MKLLSNPRFRGLFWTQFCGALNDNVFKNALVILVLYRSWSLFSLAPETFAVMAGAIFILPFLLFSARAGQLADRVDKTLLTRQLKNLELLVAGVATIGLLTHRLDLLLLSLFGFATQSAFFGPIKYSILPQILDEDELLGGNALVETSTSLGILLGTMVGGVLAALDPTAVAALVLFLAVAGRLAAQSIPYAPATARVAPTGWWRAQLDCLSLTWQSRPMLLTVLAISWFWLFGGAFLSLIPLFSRNVLGGGEFTTTILLAAFSVGIGIGSQLCEKLSGGRLELGWVPVGSLGMTLFALDFSFRPPLPLGWDGHSARLILDLTGLAISAGLFIVPLYTYIQKRSLASQRSRLIAGNSLWNSALMVTSTAILGYCVQAGVPLSHLFFGLGLLNLAVSLLAYRQMPEFVLRLVVLVLCKLCYRLKVEGRGRIPSQGAALLVANHVTLVDWLFLAAATDRPVRFVMWHTYYNLPLVKFLFRDGGVIPIGSRRRHPEIFKQAFESIHQALNNEELVIIFPEGKLTGDGEVAGFKKGVEAILKRDPVPVIPVGLIGLWGTRFSLDPNRRWHFRPEIGMTVGRPLPANTKALQMRDEVLELLGKSPLKEAA